MIRFTVITCTFNAEEVVERTLDSVLDQTYSHLEHLIVDGASKDRTVEMAEQYKAKSDAEDHCHDVIISSEPDKGLYDAMNKAVARATGDYVLFLNAGDVFPSPDTLETVAESVGDGEALPRKAGRCLPCSMATPTSWTWTAVFCDTDACRHRNG